MLYELVAIARISDPLALHTEAKELASTIGKLVIQNKGVVREIVSLGAKPLPKIMKKANERHFQGSHFLMLFDSSSAVQREILRSLKNDPRVIRANVIKVDDSTDMSPGSSVSRVMSALKDTGYEGL
ncbi:mitochondrial ribosomal small subunit component [Brettanomyces nanus]|uniref:Small ribosomal subunit protein bS6m n=1 Tax=Eeniella nana TaxID=13502 RepID=A0A875RYK1_EENNA|nr:mitochondrial ribosomal small subunit component [Brettanomyces nanus]QPG72992.1 mitochondrial ribosomal small subunit component [Brettanomyces nanus]